MNQVITPNDVGSLPSMFQFPASPPSGMIVSLAEDGCGGFFPVYTSADAPLHLLNVGCAIYGPSMAPFQGFPQQQGIVYYPPSMEQLMPVPLDIPALPAAIHAQEDMHQSHRGRDSTAERQPRNGFSRSVDARPRYRRAGNPHMSVGPNRRGPRGGANQFMQTFGGNFGHHGTGMCDFTSSYASFHSSASGSAPRRDTDSYRRSVYKTMQCEAFRNSGECTFGDRCRFAHGEEELRRRHQPQRINEQKFKTKFCNKIEEYGSCPYGAKCLFIHPGDNVDKNGMQEDAFEVREGATFGEDSS
ncbi:hypothetical protein QR680_007346 [Steinernema hermaphroditum]|uniref:C3H1-type domain-containing protein n=1 Tax=Steinernema hermaphroditum TaxID=289476 RepID=A0AA39M5V0_9BILA|nr:hypothetical protein QR680_007346 [Steinernema hermaphroditum]